MYGKGFGVANTATGITLLTPQHNRVLFVIGAGLLVSGLIIMAVSFAVARKHAAAE
jgi:hypothetical protein